MAAKRKYRSTNEYLKYLKGELNPDERYSFEKDLEADPFEREAMEGMEKVSARDVEEDLLSLHASLGSRLKRRRRRTFYYVAASVASLLIVGTVFLNIYEFNPKTAKESIVTDEAFLREGPEMETGTILTEETPEDKEAAGVVGIEEEEAPRRVETRKEAAREDAARETRARGEKTEVSEEAVVNEEAAVSEETDYDFDLIAEEQAVAPAPVTEKQGIVADEARVADELKVADEMVVVEAEPRRSQKKGRAPEAAAPVSYAAEQADEYVSGRIGGIVLSSEDMKPLPGAFIMVKGSDSGLVTDLNGRFAFTADQQDQATVIASYVGMETNEFQLSGGTENQVLMQPDLNTLNEVVVIGYDADKSRYATGAVQTVDLKPEEITYSGAEPAGGLQAYKMYIEEQIRFPAGDTLSKKEVVVLKFHVKQDGSISNIQTLRSPGDFYTGEAIRLLSDGPSWKPAKNESGDIEDVVRMRIVFKRQ